MKKLLLLATTILVLVTVFAVSCTSIEPSVVTPTPSPTPAPSPSPVPSPTPSPEPSSVPVPSPAPVPEPTVSVNDVNFRLLVSDEVIAIEEFEYFEINITKFGVHQSGGGESEGWIEYDVEDGQVDLCEVPGLDAVEVWSGQLEAGATYDKMFIYVGAGEGVPAIDAKLNSSDEEPNIKLPSNKLHINKPFTVPSEDEEVVNFVYDITVVKAGKSGQYILKPQVGESGANKEFREVRRLGKSGQAGKSNVAHLYLYQKDTEGDWSVVDGGAWGKMKYNLSGPTFDFVFNGHRLEPDTSYSLIYYADPWPGVNGDAGALIISGTSDEDGNLHLEGSVDLGMDLPHPDDANYESPGGDPDMPGEPPEPFPFGGAKIWLVLSDDYNDGDASTGPMTDWRPEKYLFEAQLMTYDDTDWPTP